MKDYRVESQNHKAFESSYFLNSGVNSFGDVNVSL